MRKYVRFYKENDDICEKWLIFWQSVDIIFRQVLFFEKTFDIEAINFIPDTRKSENIRLSAQAAERKSWNANKRKFTENLKILSYVNMETYRSGHNEADSKSMRWISSPMPESQETSGFQPKQPREKSRNANKLLTNENFLKI